MEIEKFSVRRLKISQNITNAATFYSTCAAMTNLSCVDICAPLNRRTIRTVLITLSRFTNVKFIIVPSYEEDRWTEFNSKISNSHLKISVEVFFNKNKQPKNPLLIGVDERHIPDPAFNITDVQKEILFRFNCFKGAAVSCLKGNPILQTLQQSLSLNGIILVSPEHYLQYRLEEDQVHYLEQIRNEFLLDDSNATVREALRNMISSFASTTIVPHITINSTLLERTLLVIQTLKPKILTNCWNTKIMQEDTFCVNAFDLFANPFIASIPDTNYHGQHHELTESRERKLKLASNMELPTKNVRGRKPDRSVSISVDGHSYHVLLCEVKTEKAAKDRGDLVKLGTMMKDCLDRILYHQYPRDLLYVVGILQQGQSCSLFVLNSPFNHYYQMIEVFSCTTPSSSDDMSQLYDTMRLFSYARSLVDTAISLLRQRENFLDDSDEDTHFDARLTCMSPKTHDMYYT